jgi:glycosyltransferase involved in cell wall biosynthesis
MLKSAIVSVLAQTYEDFELLILDNSSEDDTEAVVKSFNDARLRYIKHEPMSISPARNIGVKEAKGEYIAFLDDDDEWLPVKLEKELEIFTESSGQVALVYGGFIEIDSNGNELGRHSPILSGRVLEDLLSQRDDFTGSASNPMLKKKVVDELGGYDPAVVTGEDAELYLRLADKYEVAYTSDMVLKIRGHAGPRLGDRLEDAAKLDLKVMKCFEKVFEKNRKLKSMYFQRIGGKFVRIGKASEGRKYLIQAVKADPFNSHAYLQYALSIIGLSLYQKCHDIYLMNRKERQHL